ncbi:hypothetical protein GW17_00012732 [Ensete ventricosum]|nr:hypothetical protein GW17_00012732 [Ensete ventricosum]
MLRARWLLLLLALSSSLGPARPEPQVPCYFIFGDSLVDNGNNNNIASLAVANFPPYGVDFAGGPTGRFTNGLTSVDVIGSVFSACNKYFSFPLLLALLLARQYFKDVLASIIRIPTLCSSTIGVSRLHPTLRKYERPSTSCWCKLRFRGRRNTGGDGATTGTLISQGGRIPFSGQLQTYRSAVQEMGRILGGQETAATYLSKCIFSVGMGSNDYLNNYFMPALYGTSRQYTPEQYADVLIQQYSQQLRVGLSSSSPSYRMMTTLYNYGARKVALMGVGQVGCSPSELAQRSPDGVTCVEEINSAIRVFNAKLIGVVDELNALDGAHFIYINGYGIFEDIMRNSAAYGNDSIALCRNVTFVFGGCFDVVAFAFQANEYLYFDAFHPTEAANIVIGKRSYSARSPYDAYPMDIRRLAKV